MKFGIPTCLVFFVHSAYEGITGAELLKPKNTVSILSELLSKQFPYCRLSVLFVNAGGGSVDAEYWKRFNEGLIPNLMLSEVSGGITNLVVQPNQTELVQVSPPDRMISGNCGVIVVFFPSDLTQSMEFMLAERLTKPLGNPYTSRNVDKYIFITRSLSSLSSLEKSELVRKIKYKLVLTEDNNVGEEVKAHTFCPHCPEGPIRSFDMEFRIPFPDYFPDFQKNYHGAVHRVVCSRGVFPLFAYKKNDATGKYYAVRGPHVYMMYHLMQKFNFTHEVIPATGGGTGLRLPNGTWIGGVGDIVSGKADLGAVTAIDYSRNKVVEQGTPGGISREQWGFLTGPPSRVYTWKAVFWPFTLQLWIAIITASVVCVVVGHLFMRYGFKTGAGGFQTDRKAEAKDGFTFMSIAQYFAKIFLGQGGDIPVSLPQPLKILIGFWLLFVLVANTVYVSKMVTFMTFPVLDVIPKTFKELVKSDFGYTLQYFGSIMYSTLKSSKDPTIIKIVAKMELEPNVFKCIAKTLKSKTVCMTYQTLFDDLRYRNLSDRFGQTSLEMPRSSHAFYSDVGFIHEKKAAFSHNFRWVIQQSKDMGIPGQWVKMYAAELLKQKNDWHRQIGKNMEVATAEDNNLHLANLIGCFAIFIVGILTSILVFLFEKLKHHFTCGRVVKMIPATILK